MNEDSLEGFIEFNNPPLSEKLKGRRWKLKKPRKSRKGIKYNKSK